MLKYSCRSVVVSCWLTGLPGSSCRFPSGMYFFNISRKRHILGKIGLEESVKQKICEDIKNLSFRGDGKTVPASMEGKIVQDADRLDAMGAVGIARTFAYAGNKNLPLYDYAGDGSLDNPGRDSAVGHFYKKLLKLKDFMNTETAKKMAEERHRFMLDFLDRLNTEIGAE